MITLDDGNKINRKVISYKLRELDIESINHIFVCSLYA